MHRDISLLDAILINAVEIASDIERQAYLDQVCGGDADFRREVESLVADHFRAGSFLESPAAVTLTVDEPGLRIGEQIGRYKLLEKIGEGGMGVVYVAEQTAPVRRKVALKIIKPGMDSRQVIARFEAERQALALMDHPHIARILDAGMTSDTIGVNGSVPHDSHHPIPHSEFRTPHLPAGLPYFVMELVRGMPITEYCDQARLHPRKRLELFITVCQAVQHAHQKGIIHRDLKPSNILVTLHDGEPVAKVIDFGVAKAIGQQLSEHTVYTAFSQMIGTPLYMSPEQAELSGLDIDTRSDVYSLGVLLYELLTGMTPFDRATLLKAGHDEMRRMIREDEPPRPSQRISTLNAEAVSTLSAKRGLDHRQLSNLIRGELDWIAMKCLEKDRKRRYESASHLASDILHYLQGETVEACPPSISYRLRKFSRRYRSILASTTAIAVLLVAGTVVSAWQAHQAVKGRNEADLARKDLRSALNVSERARSDAESARKESEEARKESEDARKESESARKESEEARKRAEAVTQYLVSTLRSPDPARDGTTITVVETLDAAVDGAREAFKHDPPTRIHLLRAIADTYGGLELHDKAIPVRESAYRLAKEIDSPDTFNLLSELGEHYRDASRIADAIDTGTQAVDGLTAFRGRNHPDTLKAINLLAYSYCQKNRIKEAILLHDEAYHRALQHLGALNRTTLACGRGLAFSYKAAGRFDQAIELYETIINDWRRLEAKTDEDQSQLINCMACLGIAYANSGRTQEQLATYEKAVEYARATLGTTHPATLLSIGNLAAVYKQRGMLDEAVPLLEERSENTINSLGAEHPNAGRSTQALAYAQYEAGNFPKALQLYEQLVQTRRSSLGLDHDSTLISENNLAAIYMTCGNASQAIPLMEHVNQVFKQKNKENNPVALANLISLSQAYSEVGRLDDALSLYRAIFPSDADHRLDVALDRIPVKQRASVLGAHARLLLKKTDLGKAEMMARHCLNMRAQEIPDTLGHFSAFALVGEVLVQQEKYSEAEGMLLKAYQGMKALESKLLPSQKPQITQTLELIVRLYDKRSPETAAPWRQELDIWRIKLADDAQKVAGQVASSSKPPAAAPTGTSAPHSELAQNLAATRAEHGNEHADTLFAAQLLGIAYFNAGDAAAALPLFEETLRIRSARLGFEDQTTVNSVVWLSKAYVALGRIDDALRLFAPFVDREEAAPNLQLQNIPLKNRVSLLNNYSLILLQKNGFPDLVQLKPGSYSIDKQDELVVVLEHLQKVLTDAVSSENVMAVNASFIRNLPEHGHE